MAESNVMTEDEAFDLLSFLLATAELNTTEPRGYATRRLVEAAEMLVASMERSSEGESAVWLAEFKRTLANALAQRAGDPEQFTAFVREVTGEVAGELKRRAEATGTGVS